MSLGCMMSKYSWDGTRIESPYDDPYFWHGGHGDYAPAGKRRRRCDRRVKRPNDSVNVMVRQTETKGN